MFLKTKSTVQLTVIQIAHGQITQIKLTTKTGYKQENDNLILVTTNNVFNEREIRILSRSNGWLTDVHTMAANRTLQSDHPYIDGLQDTVLQQNASWDAPMSEFMQFLHENRNHWVIIRAGKELCRCVRLQMWQGVVAYTNINW